ncbi:MAG TPA: DoxX family protein [Actinomycetota bacterium]|jgi:putative oxidoreductase
MSFGLLLVRVSLGVLLFGHGTQKLFGWFGGSGIVATEGSFRRMGYRQPGLAAPAAGLTESGAGTLLVFGLVTPLAAAAVIGVMTNAAAAHAAKGLWNSKGGFELPLFYAVTAAALAFAGPGSISVDHLVGLDAPGVLWGLAAVALGVISGFAVLTTRHPHAEPRTEDGPQRRAAA